MQGGALTGSLGRAAAVVFGGQSCWPGSSSNRAAFVSWGCWSPCDQSCHSLFGQTTRGDSREGREGVRGSGWEDVEVAGNPPPPPILLLHRDRDKLQSRQRAWMIDYTVCALIGPHVITVTTPAHEVDRGVCLEAGLLFIVATVNTSPHSVVEAGVQHQRGKL